MNKIYIAIKSYYPYFLALILPFIFTLAWFLKNAELPSSDAANYMSTSVDITAKFFSNNMLHGIAAIYDIRGWRPVVFPALLVPYILITKGNLLLSYSLFEVGALVFTLIYVYLYLRLVLNRLSGVIASSIILLLPHIQIQILGFYCESMLFPAVLAALYHFYLSHNLSNKKHSYLSALFFSWAILIRPVEAVVHMLPVFVFALGFLNKNKSEMSGDIIPSVSLIALAPLLFLACALNHLSHFGIIFPIASLVLLSIFVSSVFFRRTYGSNKATESCLFTFVSIAVITASFWYFPYAKETFQWLYETSAGSVAQNTIRSTADNSGFIKQLSVHVATDGYFVFYSCSILAVISILFSSTGKAAKHKFYEPIFFLLLTSILPVLEILFTVQDIVRKSALFLPMFLMAMLMVGLRQGKYIKARVFTGVCVLITQFSLLFYTVLLNPVYNNHLDPLIGYATPKPVLASHNPNQQLVKFLQDQYNNYKFKSVDLEVNPYTLDPVDPFLFNLIIRASRLPFSASYTYFPEYNEENVLSLHSKVDVIFLSDRIDRMQVNMSSAMFYKNSREKESNPNLKIRDQLLYYYASGRLSEIGWKVKSCGVLEKSFLNDPVTEAKRNRDGIGCILVPIQAGVNR